MAKRKQKRKKKKSLPILLLLALAIVGFGGYVAWDRYHDRFEWFVDSPQLYDIHGVDVSRYQGKVDWAKVKEFGVSFAFIKATEGNTIVDTKFERNWEHTGKHGILRGAYHFYRPSVLSEEQANFFLSQVDLKPGDLPPVLDLEVTDGRSPEIIRKGVLNWMKIVERETGVKPILYTMPRFANDYLGDSLGDYPLWVASLGRRKPRVPRGWKKWHFWQHSHTGKVVGIHGHVDRNYFHGTRDELRALLIP